MDVVAEGAVARLFVGGEAPAPGGLGEANAPLPAWARFVAGVASRLAETGPPAVTVGLTVPTRAYAAVIAAASFVIERELADPATPDDAAEHLEVLRSLDPGAAVKYHDNGGTIWDARFLGIERAGDAEMICIETAPKNMRRKFPLSFALSIRPTGEADPANVLRRRQIKVPALLASCLQQPEIARGFSTTARPVCALIGTQTLITEELTTGRFCGSCEREDPGGVLQDVVRARQVTGGSRYFRTVIVPSATGPRGTDQDLCPELAIFDGGRPYLRWHHKWVSAHHLAVIDRSSAIAEDAASELSMAFINRAGETDLLSGLDQPASIEAIAFERS
jgi:hypothetical protein